MRYVIAIGGNALDKIRVLDRLSAHIVALVKEGNEVVVTHGNGPQVGELAVHEKKSLAQLTKETETEMGTQIRHSLLRAARSRFNLDPEIVLTHVLVDKDDKEFRKPSKPIGKFYMKEHAEELMKKGFVMKQLLGGYRRVVPSPKPQSIVELKRIEQLLGTNHLVIAAGGGGIAVTREGRRLAYADAVLDKDLTSSLLATKLKADALFILTKVDGVFLNFDTKREKLLKRANVEYLQRLARKGCFEAGSMLPKVEACISFVKKTRNRAIVGNLNKPNKVFKLKDVTVVVS